MTRIRATSEPFRKTLQPSVQIGYPRASFNTSYIIDPSTTGGFESLLVAPSTGHVDKWQLDSYCSRTTSQKRTGTYSLEIASGGTGTARWEWGYPFPYKLSYGGYVLGSVDPNDSDVYIQLLDSDANAISSSKVDLTGLGDISSGFTQISGTYTGGDAYGLELVNVSTSADVFFDDVSVVRVADISTTTEATSALIDISGNYHLLCKLEYSTSGGTTNCTIFLVDNNGVYTPSYSETILNSGIAHSTDTPTLSGSGYYHGDTVVLPTMGFPYCKVHVATPTTGTVNLWVLPVGKLGE